jgi:hypothetical protein
MKHEFTPYEQALELEEIGFNEPCLAHLIGFGDGTKENGLYKIKQQQVFYPGDYASSDDKADELGLHPFVICGVPLYQQAFRFFREKYGLKHDIDDDNVGTKFYYKIRSYTDKFDNYNDIIKPMREERDWSKIEFYSYEEAELACLIKLIEIVKEKK